MKSGDSATKVDSDKRQDQIAARSNTDRAEAFSDSILAVIITLLTLDLRPPLGAPGQLLSGLLQQWPTYLAYVASYAFVAVVWLNHRAAFKRISSMDRGVHWANLGILFTTALLPFATSVVADVMQGGNESDARTAIGLYALVGVLLWVSWLVFFRYLSVHPDLVHEKAGEDHFQRQSPRARRWCVLYIVAGVIGFVISPSVALVIFLALSVYYGITNADLYTS